MAVDDQAEVFLARQTRPGPLPPAPAAPELDNAGQALAWARADRAILLACLDYASRTSQHARVITLTGALAGLLRYDGPWADAVTLHSRGPGRIAPRRPTRPGQRPLRPRGRAAADG